MESKNSVLNRVTWFRKSLTVSIIVITTTTLIASTFSGCAKKEEPTVPNKQPPMPETRQLVIPSELEPEAVLPDFSEKQYIECAYDVNDDTKACSENEIWFEDELMGKDLEKGYFREYSWYILPDGKEIGPGFPLLIITVYKYQTTLAAKQAFTAFTEYIGYEDTVLDGVKIKWYVPKEMPKKSTYMMQSNNFIIYIESSHEVAKDAATRIIEPYSVPINTGN
jgi:hypothetical protein